MRSSPALRAPSLVFLLSISFQFDMRHAPVGVRPSSALAEPVCLKPCRGWTSWWRRQGRAREHLAAGTLRLDACVAVVLDEADLLLSEILSWIVPT